MSKATIDYEAMPTAAETEKWDLRTDQRKLLGAIIKKPRKYEIYGPNAQELRVLCSAGVVDLVDVKPAGSKTKVSTWHATAAGYGLMASPLPDNLEKGSATYFRARNWGRVDRLPTKACAKCRRDYTPERDSFSLCCPLCFDPYRDAQHLADVRAAQNMAAGYREGWASTKPGQTKYHHYDDQGNSKCSYMRHPGALHYADETTRLSPGECCSSCDLHLLKSKQPTPAPKAVARASKTTSPAGSAQLFLF